MFSTACLTLAVLMLAAGKLDHLYQMNQADCCRKAPTHTPCTHRLRLHPFRRHDVLGRLHRWSC
jgi:hypothetical protein